MRVCFCMFQNSIFNLKKCIRHARLAESFSFLSLFMFDLVLFSQAMACPFMML